MSEVPALQRHDLAWLTAAGARAARPMATCLSAGRDDGDAERLLAGWVAAGRPLVVARQTEAEVPGWIRLGLALAPALGKGRLAFQVPIDGIARAAPPPDLREAAHALPVAWQSAASALLDAPEIVAAAPRVYGSAAMQAVTGLQCLGAGSDLDLLLDPRDWPAALAAVRVLMALRRGAPRIDGEIRNPAGEAVAWRELAGPQPRVLSKGRRHVGLIERAAFEASFESANEPTGRVRGGLARRSLICPS